MDATTAAAEDLSRASSNIFKLEASAISEAEKLAKAEDELDVSPFAVTNVCLEIWSRALSIGHHGVQII